MTHPMSPLRLRLIPIVHKAASGSVTNQLDDITIRVARRYRPWAPTKLQHVIPTVIVMFPNPTRGMRSFSMCCRVGSEVNHVGKFCPHMNIIEVMKTAVREETIIDLYDETRAMMWFPFPKWYAVRTAAASLMPSVAASKSSQSVPRMPHVATSAGPKSATKKVSNSHSPYSKNDPRESGIAVATVFFTAAKFLNAKLPSMPPQKADSHPFHSTIPKVNTKKNTPIMRWRKAMVTMSVLGLMTHIIATEATSMIPSKIPIHRPNISWPLRSRRTK
mmetsp:Transcript_10561/g.31118  ORF Transcript_10561/g.31118 Transcript_10561/m.31118 type:complete len:275 (-) Transcript_10561:1007-1831(-)